MDAVGIHGHHPYDPRLVFPALQRHIHAAKHDSGRTAMRTPAKAAGAFIRESKLNTKHRRCKTQRRCDSFLDCYYSGSSVVSQTIPLPSSSIA